ncbi:unnamed protein product [Bursaphelenchus okinawaensis]|uniref:Uncharacterized protein n=1 Tax=Bursaphelenchus okinawaensis TaxID=465554 RepID=A0A811JQH5_9BILA|nr:unnamed protein product [Bursaphelenchus okinawaensis]CAG9078488.1 unnamed protein product [Bursaphelenchus okinawaensis]
MDITDSYYSKSTKLQDREQTKALKTAGALERFHKIRLLYGSNVLQNPVDVEVNVTPIDEVIIGDNVIVEIGFKNNTQVFRTVKVSVRVHNRHKNGKIGVQVNSYKEVYELDSGEEESLRLLTPVAEYIRASNNDSHDYVAVISGMVEETGQIIFHEEDFHLTTSVIGIVAPAIATYGDNVVALIAIVNPLPEPLKQCRLELVAGHDADKKIVVERMPSEIAAGQRVKLPIRVRLSGMCLRVLVAKLYCQPLGYATAVHVLEVKDE